MANVTLNGWWRAWILVAILLLAADAVYIWFNLPDELQMLNAALEPGYLVPQRPDPDATAKSIQDCTSKTKTEPSFSGVECLKIWGEHIRNVQQRWNEFESKTAADVSARIGGTQAMFIAKMACVWAAAVALLAAAGYAVMWVRRGQPR